MKTIGNLGMIAACACLVACGPPARASGAQLGTMQADRILFLGNSITFCPQLTSTDWWGLSASSPANDYAHLLTQSINAASGGSLAIVPPNPHQGDADNRWYPSDGLPNYSGNILNMADLFERNFTTWDNARIQNQLDAKPDIVVVQMGENMAGGTWEQFGDALDVMLTGLANSGSPQIFVTSHILGENSAVDDMKRALCAKDPTHRVFVDLNAVWENAANHGPHDHPNDAGMAAIADTLFGAMTVHSVPEPSSIVLSFTALVATLGCVWKRKRK